MSIRIKHPEFKAGRDKAIGLEFIDGYAEVEELAPETRAALIQHGFEITETTSGEKPLDKFTKKELIQHAIQHNIVVDEKASKEVILEQITNPTVSEEPLVEDVEESVEETVEAE